MKAQAHLFTMVFLGLHDSKFLASFYPDLFQSLEGAADSHWMHPEALGCLIDRDPSVVAKRGQEGSLPLLGCQRSLDGHLTPLTPVAC